ncbi:Serine/threonine protein kinase [Tupanvirus deep ocean]|uniref:Serine/threonine protein kinase n=2 Tax=Tupanvirus TaxID=2094720 RepID=A0AC62A8P6_9VIRU|nr:Serine/threonine protein kinase [Tupanvirus deep ocean]QKU34099.1 Serine/threonine protein kinase [Tupanvirus deep ocean]
MSDVNNTCISGKYETKCLLCSGSFGKVYLANKMDTGETLVIKIIKKIKGKTENKIKRDTEIPKIIEHPNIVKINDFIETDTHAFVVYPYIDNSICLSKIKIHELNFENKTRFHYMLNMMCQICNAIEFMHSKLVVHRDIKPQNIVVSPNLAILIDFDLAFIINNSKYPLRKGIIGTPNYLAPEIWKNCEDICYQLTDVYSFGVTLYFVFNKKKLPYVADKVEDLEYEIRYSNPIPSNSGYPALDKLIMKIISKDPSNRPSISQIKDNLQKII